MIGRFIALSITVHAVAAGMYATYPRVLDISIDIPTLEVSLASETRADRENESTASPPVLKNPEILRSRPVAKAQAIYEITPTEGLDSPLGSTESSRIITEQKPSIASQREPETPQQAPDRLAGRENTDTTEAERANHLTSQLRGAVNRHFVYPPLARRRGWQGTVQVGLRLDTRGQLGALRVVRSSGYAILDEDAIQTLERVGSIPRAREWLNGRPFETELTVIYRLLESRS